MARKVDLEKRKELAQSAFVVMRERGVLRTSMSDLAKALDMKRSTLYWYFKDLNAIFEVVLGELLADVALYVQGGLEGVEHPSNHPIDMLYRVALRMHEYFDQREDLVMMLFQLWAAGGGADHNQVFAIAAEYNQPRRAMMTTWVRDGIEAGLVAPCDADLLVQSVASFSDGLLVNRVAGLVEVKPLLSFLWEHMLLPLRREP